MKWTKAHEQLPQFFRKVPLGGETLCWSNAVNNRSQYQMV